MEASVFRSCIPRYRHRRNCCLPFSCTPYTVQPAQPSGGTLRKKSETTERGSLSSWFLYPAKILDLFPRSRWHCSFCSTRKDRGWLWSAVFTPPLKPRVRALVAHSRCWLSVSLSKFLARYFLACLIDWGGTVDRSDSCRKGDRTGITNVLFCFCCLLSNWNFRLLASSVGLFSYSTFGFNRPLFFAYLETIIQRNDSSSLKNPSSEKNGRWELAPFAVWRKQCPVIDAVHYPRRKSWIFSEDSYRN